MYDLHNTNCFENLAKSSFLVS